MRCSVCGSTSHEVSTVGCPNQGMGVVEYEKMFPAPLGWICASCGASVSPNERTCPLCPMRVNHPQTFPLSTTDPRIKTACVN